MKQTGGTQRNAYLPLLYFAVILLPVFLLGCYLYNEKLRISQFQELTTHKLQEHVSPPQQIKEDKYKKIDLVPLDVCDVFTGKWVLDNVTHPLYKEDECEFLSEWVACTRNGRPDSKYQKWRWQPRDCSLPRSVTTFWEEANWVTLSSSSLKRLYFSGSRFNAKLLLEKLRGKKLMFIGDSIHYNQWQSMVCMVQSIISSEKKTLKHTAQMSIFNTEVLGTVLYAETNSPKK